MQTLVQIGTALARGVQEASGEALKMVEKRVRINPDGMNAVVGCRILLELLAVEGALVRNKSQSHLHQQPPYRGAFDQARDPYISHANALFSIEPTY